MNKVVIIFVLTFIYTYFFTDFSNDFFNEMFSRQYLKYSTLNLNKQNRNELKLIMK